MSDPTIASEPEPSVDPATAGTRIVVSGVIDQAVVTSVENAVRDALGASTRVEVDVRGVEGWADDAVRSLAECARLGPGVEFVMDGKRRTPGGQP